MSGVRNSGAAAADPDRSVATVTIAGGNNPFGIFIFNASSLETQVSPSNSTVYLVVNRTAGSIGKWIETVIIHN